MRFSQFAGRQTAAHGQLQSGFDFSQCIEYRRGNGEMAEAVAGNVDEKMHDAF